MQNLLKSLVKISFQKISLLSFVFLMLTSFANAQEKYGKTLNLGLGIGYYKYVNNSVPVVHLNYEIDVAKNFTLAPFLTYFSYTYNYGVGNPKNFGYYGYSYTETVIPIGIKGSYYFDEFLVASPKWDFYLAGSLGFTYRKRTWSNNYVGNSDVNSSPLYLDLHLGTEYHMTEKLGLFLDLSSGVSTLGLGIHF